MYSNQRKDIAEQFKITGQDNQILCRNDAVETAILFALEASFKDFNFRTLTKKQSFQLKDEPTMTACLIKALNKEQTVTVDHKEWSGTFTGRLIDYFKNEPIEEERAFDEWHSITCTFFLQSIQNEKIYEKIHFGKAQKIVNMIFKHLYCVSWGKEDKEDFEAYFKHCHLTLDSFTLEWFRRDVAKKWYNSKTSLKTEKAKSIKTPQEGRPFPKWSNIDFKIGSCSLSFENYDDPADRIENGNYHYMFFETVTRRYFHEKKPYGDCTVFQAEFYIWKEIQIHMALEGLFGQDLGQKASLRLLNAQKDAYRQQFQNEKAIISCIDQYEKNAAQKNAFQQAQEIFRLLPLNEKIKYIDELIKTINDYTNVHH